MALKGGGKVGILEKKTGLQFEWKPSVGREV
jgi:hypothetical protein